MDNFSSTDYALAHLPPKGTELHTAPTSQPGDRTPATGITRAALLLLPPCCSRRSILGLPSSSTLPLLPLPGSMAAMIHTVSWRDFKAGKFA